MDRKKLVLLLGALVIAIGTALAARSMLAGSPAPEVEADLLEFLDRVEEAGLTEAGP